MKHLYYDKLQWTDVKKAWEEVDKIETQLEKISPDLVIWEMKDINKQPPWGKKTAFTEEHFKEWIVFFNPTGKYVSKQYVGMNFLQTSILNGEKLKLPMESTVFLYKLTFEHGKAFYLSIATIRINGKMLIQHFYINAPTGLQKQRGL